MTASGRRERWIQALLAALLFLSYAYFLPRRVDWNQNGRLDLALAIVEQGRLAIDDYRGNTGDYAHFGAHYYSDKAPGASFLAIPFYWAFRMLTRVPAIGGLLRAAAASAAPGPASAQELAGLFPWRGYFALALYAATLGAAALPGALLGVLLYRLARRQGASAGDAALVTVVYGLGTTALPYSGALYGHMLAAFCLFAAFYFLQSWRAQGDGWRPALAGLSLGYSAITEYPMALPAAVIGVYGLYRIWQCRAGLRPVAWIIAGALPPLLLLAAYDMAIYGTPLPAGYQHSELWQAQVNTGFMTLTAPSLERLWGITFSPFRGLFFLSPALLWAAPALVTLARRRAWRAEAWAIAGVIAAIFLFNSASVVWWGGFAIGPRYASPAAPFLALPIAAWLSQWRPARWGFVVAGLVSAFSVWAQTITSIQFYPPEMYHFPLLQVALPALARGEIALNLGNVLGLRGPASLLPLAGALLLIGAALAWLSRPAGGRAA
jgi:hypothetical protein